MRNSRKKHLGITLVELMLVSAIIGWFFVMYIGYTAHRTRMMQIDRASQQMQQILNGALSYYVANGTWPTDLTQMQPPTSTVAYVPQNITSPWNTTYTAVPTDPTGPAGTGPFQLFTVTLTLPNGLQNADAIGSVLAGRLPYGLSTSGVVPTVVTATVNIPGQNVNNATAVNFAGVYHSGACVPVPSCPPTDAAGNPMIPQIMVSPSQVSGNFDGAGGPTNVYPITSFTAWATGPAADPPACPNGSTGCVGASSTSGQYWRVCLKVVTSRGDVVWDAATAQYAIVMAMSRCSVQNEASGSPFTTFGP